MRNTFKNNGANETLTMNASGVEYSGVSSCPEPARYFHRLNPQTENAYTIKRFWDDTAKKKTFRPINQETDRDGKPIHAPYIAGGETDGNRPPKDRLTQLWSDVYKARRLYIVEGEKCAESLKNALKTPDLDGAVLTMGSCDLATHWGDSDSWAAYLKKKNPKAEIIVFSDNDKPGRKAASETAEAFYNAGFKNVSIVDLATHKPSEKFPGGDDKYDIADWIDEGRDVASLLDVKNGFIRKHDPYNSRQFWDAILQAAETRRGDLEIWELVAGDGAQGLDGFGDILEELPAPLADTVRECATGFNIDPITVLSSDLTVLGGWVGKKRADMRVDGRDIDALVHTTGVGDSGSGKTPLTTLLVAPILEMMLDEKTRTGAAGKRLFYHKEDLNSLMRARREAYKSDDKEELKNIEEKIDALREIIAALEAPAQTYLMKAASPQGVIRTLDRNAKAARAQRRNAPGAIVYTSEGQRIYNARLGSRQTADEWGVYCAIMDGDINNAETKDDATPDKEYAVSAAFCISSQGTSCNWIRDVELTGNGLANRVNWVYLDYQYGINPDFADAEKLDKRRRLIEALYEWQGATFYASEELTKAYSEWRNENKLRADKFHKRGDKATVAYLLKNEKQVLRIALILHIVRQFWGLIENDTRDFTQWRRLGRRERLSDAPKLLKELETAENYDASKYDALKHGETFPGSLQYWQEYATDGNNPRLIVPLSEFELAKKIIKRLEAARARCLGIIRYETDKTREIRLDNYSDAVSDIQAKAKEKAETGYAFPKKLDDEPLEQFLERNAETLEKFHDLDAETLGQFNALGVKGVYIVPRRVLAQQCTQYKTKTKQEEIDPELEARGLALFIGASLAFIEYAD